MIKLSDVEITKEQIAKGGKLILVDISENALFVDGKRTEKTDGFKYTVVLTNNKFEKIIVKVAKENAVITAEELSNANEEIVVDFTNFIGKFYQNNNGVGFTATADKCILLNKKGVVANEK